MDVSSSESTKASLCILLVHGTWAHGMFRRSPPDRKNSWYLPRSEFLKNLTVALDCLGVQAEIRSFIWSGANTLNARIAASNRLATLLRDKSRLEKPLPHIIVAHSHGGNVAVNAINKIDPSDRPLAAITLATPFIVTSSRAHSRLEKWAIGVLKFLFFGLPAFLAALMFLMLVHLIPDFLFGWNILDLKGWGGGISFAFLFMIPLIILGGLINDFVESKVNQFFSKRKKTALNFSGNGNFAPTKLFCVRAPRDEASTILSATVLVDLLCSLARNIISSPFNFAVNLIGKKNLARFRLARQRIRKFSNNSNFVVSLVCHWAEMWLWLTIVGAFILSIVFTGLFIFTDINFNFDGLPVRILVFLPAAFIFTSFVGATLLFMVVSTAMLVVVVIFYGWEYCMVIWSVHVYAESQPSDIPCETMMLGSEGGNSLRHSIYMSKNTVQTIAEYAKRLTCQPSPSEGRNPA
ncbi:hypothetical protein OAM69_00875 [bacterium]|nr:hypothetical protein [bacterium]